MTLSASRHPFCALVAHITLATIVVKTIHHYLHEVAFTAVLLYQQAHISTMQGAEPTSFPGSLILTPSEAPWGGKMRDPGNKVGSRTSLFT